MHQEASKCNACYVSEPPQVGTNLTDLTLRKKKVTIRELGGCMSPIWPSYFEDCSSIIVCSYIVYCVYLQHLPLTVGIFWQFFVCVSTVHGRLSQRGSDIFVLCPAAVSSVCWASAQPLCAYPVQQKVLLKCSYQTVHSLDIPAKVSVGTLHTFHSMFFTPFQGHALHYEHHRDKVIVQNGWHHYICHSTYHNTGGQCPLWTGTSGGAELAGV